MPQKPLSRTQLEIIRRTALGENTKSIAISLKMRLNTLYSHLQRIEEKSGIRGVAHLTHYAIANKLVPLEHGTAITQQPPIPMTPEQFETFSRAVSFVSGQCNVALKELDSGSRKAPTVFARNVLCLLLREHAGLSLKEIGLLIGRSTGNICHALAALENDVQSSCAVARTVANLVAEFRRSINHQLSKPSTSP